MLYKVYANGEFLGSYKVPNAWSFDRALTRLQRVALVAVRGDMKSFAVTR